MTSCSEITKKSSLPPGNLANKSSMNSVNIMHMFSTGTDFSKKTQPKNKDVKKKKNEKENPSNDANVD